MTEIPEHLRKRAEEARHKAAAAKADDGREAFLPANPERPSGIPAHLLERARSSYTPQAPGAPLLPGEPFNPPLTSEERERIAVILVNLRASTDEAINNLMENAKEAGDRALEAQKVLERRHRTAMIVAVTGTFAVTALLVMVIILLSMRFG